mgnify:CR=1 FL=1
MKSQQIKVKRRPSRSPGMRTFFASVARVNKRKSHRAATTASSNDFDGDMSNLGITRALVVILIIHIVAILGIFVHSYRIEESSEAAEKKKRAEVTPIASSGQDESDAVRIREGESEYTVGKGETYASIAERLGFDEAELRRANENMVLRQGRRLRVPAQKIVAVEPADIRALRDQESRDASAGSTQASNGDGDAIRVEPQVERDDWVVTDAAKRADGTEPTGSGEAAHPNTYRVNQGDTFWGIARQYQMTPEKLMKHNGIEDPRKLRVGMTLKIPE